MFEIRLDGCSWSSYEHQAIFKSRERFGCFGKENGPFRCSFESSDAVDHRSGLMALDWFSFFLSDWFSGETGTKRDLISTSRELADMSEHLTYLAKQLASECMDRRMRTVSTIEWHRSNSFLLICSESSASQWTHSNHRHSTEDLIDSEGDDVWNLRWDTTESNVTAMSFSTYRFSTIQFK